MLRKRPWYQEQFERFKRIVFRGTRSCLLRTIFGGCIASFDGEYACLCVEVFGLTCDPRGIAPSSKQRWQNSACGRNSEVHVTKRERQGYLVGASDAPLTFSSSKRSVSLTRAKRLPLRSVTSLVLATSEAASEGVVPNQ